MDFKDSVHQQRGHPQDPRKKQWYAEKIKVEWVDSEIVSSELRETHGVSPFDLPAHSKLIINNRTI